MASTDYFQNGRTCFNYEPRLNGGARTGNYCVGMFSLHDQYRKKYREYIQGKFIHPLEEGKEYLVEFYICLETYSGAAVSGFGAYISNHDFYKKNLKRLKVGSKNSFFSTFSSINLNPFKFTPLKVR
jgi:hypothetical protein